MIQQIDLVAILEKHKLWLSDRAGGEKADLSKADLFKADLTGANLRWAILTGAILTGANLTRADLSGARGILTIGPGGSRGDMLYAVHGEIVMIKTGCYWGTPDEFI